MPLGSVAHTSTKYYFAFTVAQTQYCKVLHNCPNFGPGSLIFSGDVLSLNRIDRTLRTLYYPASTGRVRRANRIAFQNFCHLVEGSLGGRIEFYFPALSYPFYNWLYSRYARLPNVSVFLYTEGFSSYLNIQTAAYSTLKFWALRYFAGFDGGHFGTHISGHPHGYSMPRVAAVATPFPNLMSWTRLPVLPFSNPFLPTPAAKLVDEVWFIGQPHLILKMGTSLFFDRLFKALRSDFDQRLKYKAHHFDSVGSIAAAESAGFLQFAEDGPVEDLLRVSQPKAIISFRSTALINARQICGSDTDVISFAPLLCRPPEEECVAEQIIQVLRQFGVRGTTAGTALYQLERELTA